MKEDNSDTNGAFETFKKNRTSNKPVVIAINARILKKKNAFDAKRNELKQTNAFSTAFVKDDFCKNNSYIDSD